MDPRKQQLVIELDHRRDSLDRALDRVSNELSVTHQVKRSINEHPTAWFAGAFGLTALTTMALRRPKPEARKRRLLGWLFKTSFQLGKPFLAKWALEEIQRRHHVID